jgi:hypothetical protein
MNLEIVVEENNEKKIIYGIVKDMTPLEYSVNKKRFIHFPKIENDKIEDTLEDYEECNNVLEIETAKDKIKKIFGRLENVRV